jgi:hypothetical protein
VPHGHVPATRRTFSRSNRSLSSHMHATCTGLCFACSQRAFFTSTVLTLESSTSSYSHLGWTSIRFACMVPSLHCNAHYIYIYIYNNIKYIFFHTIFYLLYHHYIYAASLCRLPHSQNIYTRLLLSYPLVDLVVLLVNMFLFASQPAVAHAWRPPPARS